MVTEYGLEGGALYQLTRELRESPQIDIDFRPGLSRAQLKERWRDGMDLKEGAIKLWRLSAAAAALIEEMVQPQTLTQWIAAVKALPRLSWSAPDRLKRQSRVPAVCLGISSPTT